jgi:hypothetical protein
MTSLINARACAWSLTNGRAKENPERATSPMTSVISSATRCGSVFRESARIRLQFTQFAQ